MSDLMFFLLILFLLAAMGIAIEMIRFPNKDMKGYASQLRIDITEIIKGFLEKPQIPHIIEDSLYSEVRNVVEPFLAVGMDVDIAQYNNGLPLFCIQFVPSHKLTEQELKDLTERIKIKFRRYLTARGLRWYNFATFKSTEYAVEVTIYYAEFEKDIVNLKSLYRRTLIEKSGSDFGALRDDDLDRELKEHRQKQ